MPVGGGRYELYSEPPDNRNEPAAEAPKGVWHGLIEKFRTVLASVEREHGARASGAEPNPAAGTAARMKARFLRWLAERVAEQRLLWRLRTIGEARLQHPDDMPGDRAHHLLQAILKRDADWHFVWATVAGLLFVASGAIAVLPGPNVVAYYFAFRLVGHALSWRGARHGMREVTWALAPEALLTELRGVGSLESSEREARVASIAARLGAPRLPRFFLRTSAPD